MDTKCVCSDHEFIEQQETHLLAVCQRTMALPIGRLVLFTQYESFGCATINIVPSSSGACSVSQVPSLCPLPLSPYQLSTLVEGLHLSKDIALLT